jgi:hypothetical protein
MLKQSPTRDQKQQAVLQRALLALVVVVVVVAETHHPTVGLKKTARQRHSQWVSLVVLVGHPSACSLLPLSAARTVH